MAVIVKDGLELPYGIKPPNPEPVDTWSGPYDSVTDANDSIPSGVRFKTMLVRIIISGEGFIYWYKDGILDSNLVLFASGGGGGGSTTASNGLTKSGDDIKLGGNITETTGQNTTVNVTHEGSYAELQFKPSGSNTAVRILDSVDGSMVAMVGGDLAGTQTAGLYFDLDDSQGLGSGGVKFVDSRTAKKGIELTSQDYSGFTDDTLVPKKYVDAGASRYKFITDADLSSGKYTVLSSDIGKKLFCSFTIESIIYIPNGLTTGFNCAFFRQEGTAVVTIEAQGTLYSAGTKLMAENTAFSIEHIGSNVIYAVGALGTGDLYFPVGTGPVYRTPDDTAWFRDGIDNSGTPTTTGPL